MAFVVELATLAGDARGQPAWRGLRIERVLNGGMIVGCQIDNDDQAAVYATVGDHALRVWEDGILRFHGKLREPHVRKPGTIELAAGSPYTLLDRRQLQAAKTFTQIDQGTIVKTIIDAENVRSNCRLRVAPFLASMKRDRTYELGKSVQEIVAQLAAVQQGPYFLENPIIDHVANRFAELVLRAAPGAAKPGVRLEYGEGTLANCSDYALTTTLPRNGVTYIGATASGSGTPPSSRVTDAASIAQYDLIEGWYDDPDVTVKATLTEKANDQLRPAPGQTLEMTLVAGGKRVGGPPVPRLWWDFDVGDTVYASVRDETTEVYDLPLIVAGATLDVSELDGSEQLALTLGTQAEDDG